MPIGDVGHGLFSFSFFLNLFLSNIIVKIMRVIWGDLSFLVTSVMMRCDIYIF